MTPAQVLAHFKTKTEIARVLGKAPSTIAEWFEEGGKVPDGHQYQLFVATNGALQPDKPADRRPATPPALPAQVGGAA